jgi:pyridinium-3,5-biscarboxylic acid mononucleotide sulfurtransferase
VTDLPTLEHLISDLDSVVVGLSGGVDSSLLAAVCHRVLGQRSVAVVARSPSLPARELHDAAAIATRIGIDLEVVDTAEVADPRYAANPRNRCMFCKDHQFEAMRAVADRRGFAHLAHGEVLDDLDGHRPGRASAERFGVRSPLREAGLDKKRVRMLANELALPVWDKPAFACLASRIPTGSEVTPKKLRQVEHAENHLFTLGFRAFRVRHHGEVARIELNPGDHQRARDHAVSIVTALRRLGFREVTLDTAGLGAAEPGRALPLLQDPA